MFCVFNCHTEYNEASPPIILYNFYEAFYGINMEYHSNK